MSVGANARTYTYDANGNLTSDGTRTFEWDARNQLVAMVVGTTRSEYLYDGKQQRTRVVVKEGGVVQSDVRAIWCDASALCEEREANGTDVKNRLFGYGAEGVTGDVFFVRDHLGSHTEVLTAAGNLLARYAFDPWGRRTVTHGEHETTTGFAGQQWDQASELYLTRYRVYMPEVGRWMSEDPLGLDGGINQYSYADQHPIARVDPTGLVAVSITEPSVGYVPSDQIEGCGRTRMRLNFDGGCTCVGNEWRASLSIRLSGQILIANDTYVTPKSVILWHERRHWAAMVQLVQLAKAAGEAVEAKPYPNKPSCDAAVKSWRAEWWQWAPPGKEPRTPTTTI